MNPRLLAVLGAAVSIFLPSCSAGHVIDDSCFVDLVLVTPRTGSAVVGDTVTFQAALAPTECVPPGLDPQDWRWSSGDTLLVTIDSLSGLAVAVGPGLVAIHVVHAGERFVQSNAVLEVQPGP